MKLNRKTFLEPPKGPSDLCPRLNGFYSHPDPGVCHIFYACVDGTAEEYTCSSGLWFDEYSGVCNWPEVTDRTECKAEAYGRKKNVKKYNFQSKVRTLCFVSLVVFTTGETKQSVRTLSISV